MYRCRVQLDPLLWWLTASNVLSAYLSVPIPSMILLMERIVLFDNRNSFTTIIHPLSSFIAVFDNDANLWRIVTWISPGCMRCLHQSESAANSWLLQWRTISRRRRFRKWRREPQTSSRHHCTQSQTSHPHESKAHCLPPCRCVRYSGMESRSRLAIDCIMIREITIPPWQYRMWMWSGCEK